MTALFVNVQIYRPFLKFVMPVWIEEASQAAYRMVGKSDNAEVNFTIHHDLFLKKLNKQYRSIDSTTDVLSFENGQIDPETGNLMLGDIAISYEKALAQSLEAGHPVENEIKLLTVHGMLHLLGYDHAELNEKLEMWRVQKRVLEQIHCQLAREPGEE